MSNGETSREFWKRTPLNTVVNVVRTLVMSLAGILLVPYYIDNLGLSAYGIIPLATTMTSYVMVVSDSLGTACTRYSVLAIHQNNNVSKTLNTAFFGIVRGCAVLIPVVILLSLLTPVIFNIEGNNATDVQVMFLLILISSLIIASVSSLISIFNAFNKLYLLYIARTFNTVIQVGLIVLLFSMGTPSLLEVGISYLLASVLYFAMIFVLAKRCYPPLKIKRHEFDMDVFKKMGTLGIWSVISKFGSMLYIQASLVLINMFLGSEAGGGFAIVTSLISMVHTACWSITTSFEPLIFNDYAKNNIEELKAILRCGIKFISILFALPVAFIIVLSPEIITAWVGKDYVYLSTLVSIAMISDVIYCASTVLQGVPVAFVRMKPIAVITLVFGLANIITAVFALTVMDGDMKTVMWIWLFWTIIYTSATVFYNESILETKKFYLMKPIILGTGLSFVIAALIRLLTEIIAVAGSWFVLIPLAALMLAAYIPVMFAMMNKNEKQMVLSIMPDVLKKKLSRFV